MRRFYQESWQGIPFEAFARMSFVNLADATFYGAFYEELFARYPSMDVLPARWRIAKERDAHWLVARIHEQRMPQNVTDAEEIEDIPEAEDAAPVRVLSIGSGVGFMEKILLTLLPDMELHVNETSTVGMRWLREYIPQNRIYIGFPPACLPADVTYDMIYLSALDYAIPSQELEHMLRALRAQLTPTGRLYCLSASLLEEESPVGSMVNVFKIGIRAVLHVLAIRPQQFWGWRRTRREYQHIFHAAGFTAVEDGMLDAYEQTYWIGGR